MKNKQKCTRYLFSGYTLLELLVVVVILGIIAVGSTSLFLASLRGGGKVQVMTEVKQNGQQAMNAMEQMIRNSLSVTSTCDGLASDDIRLVARDSQALTFECLDVGVGENGRVASNSARLTSSRVVVTSCSFTCSSNPARGPLVTIDFTLRQAGASEGASDRATANFSTSVGVRSY